MTISVSELNDCKQASSGQSPPIKPAVRGQLRNYNLVKLRARDEPEFDRMVAAESPSIARLVHRLVGWNDSDDVLQEVFIAAWSALPRFRADSEISTWLYSIAIIQCRRHRRNLAMRIRNRKKLLARKKAIGAQRKAASGAASRLEESAEQIYVALNGMSQRDREVIVLCGLEGNTVDEAARLLGIRKNTTEVRLHRARAKLKELLRQTEHE